jgi:DNA-binding CsgD family transcriptional regulator
MTKYDTLTPREKEVFALLAMRRTRTEIAAALVISPNTVKEHVRHIYRKLRISRASMIAAVTVTAEEVDHAA